MDSHTAIGKGRIGGFSLIELMVGLVIGLLATLVITNSFSMFEKQKRVTTGTSDAQTNGAIALFIMQRDLQNAGYGLPVFDYRKSSEILSPFECITPIKYDIDNNAATPDIDLSLSPIDVVDGGANSDTLVARSSNSMKAGVSMVMNDKTVKNDPLKLAKVDTTLGCEKGNIALIISTTNPPTCTMTNVTARTDIGIIPGVITIGSSTNIDNGHSISCFDGWNATQYTVTNNQLTRATGGVAAEPVVADIVNMQVQYGISAIESSNLITEWVNATGAFAAPTVADRNRIKAVRVAVVARNGVLESTEVTTTCTTARGTVNNGPCAWNDADVPSAAPGIDLSGDANWRRYRYRVYETTIPLRNVMLSRKNIEQSRKL